MKPLLCLALWLPLLATASEWSVRPLSEIALYPEFRAPASVISLNESRIAAEVSGRIEALPVRVGQSVAKGDELARIDAASYRIEADRAAAQVSLVGNRIELARRQLAQSRVLAERQFVSADALKIKETELAVLRSELAAVRQTLAAARLQVARTVIHAPYAGIVRERLASVGDLAAPGTALLVLSATDDTETRARVPSSQVASLRAAGEWQLVAGGASHALRLSRVSPVVDPAGQAQEAVFDAREPLPPGLAGEVRWRSTVAHLPPGYVLQREGTLGAYVERAGRAVFVPLPAAQAGRPVPVDWPPDTRVIDEGRFALGLSPAATPGGAARAGGARGTAEAAQ